MSTFVCPHCGTVNIDCGKEGYKTPVEIKLEKQFDVMQERIRELEDELKEDLMKDIAKTEQWFEKRGFTCSFIDLGDDGYSYLLIQNRDKNACARINFARGEAVMTVSTDIDNERIWEILNKV